jgi:glycosyltransferase involved in cell wall biosynthesis
MPNFSVILATRDRPALFAEALHSVLAQADADFEVVVVNDGSAPAHRAAYEATLAAAAAALPGRVQAHWLVHRPRGHGQSYALNYGVAQASGDYVCFLDDDDSWTDPGHLARAARAIGAGADLYMANQAAFRGTVQEAGPVWIEGLAPLLAARGLAPAADGSFEVGVEALMALTGFCHLNALTVRRAFYEEIGGMDEGVRWECDRDLFLRLIDRAQRMLHHPAVVARHNIPDPAKGASMTTSLAAYDRWLFQLRVLDKASLFARHGLIRAHARQHKAYALKRIAEALRAQGDWVAAANYARQALGAGPTLKWAAFTAYCTARALLAGGAAGRG